MAQRYEYQDIDGHVILLFVHPAEKKETRREKRNKDHNKKNCPHTIKHADNLFIKS
jgi:hypothetical protein